MNGDDHPGLLTQRTKPASTGESAQSHLIDPVARSSGIDKRSLNDSQPSVELHIEELVLHGFAPGDRYPIGEAVERELTRLFTEQGVPPTITYQGETGEVDGGLFETDPFSDAEAIGARLARAIYGGFSR